MGFAKRQMMKWEDLGIAPGNGGNVCDVCICDPVLARFITENATELACNYCHRSGVKPFACSLADVAEEMAESIHDEWTSPVNELPYDEGGYVGDVIDGWDLLDEIGFEPDTDGLFDDVASYFTDHEWCRRNHFELTFSERLQFGWQRFCNVVMHQRRYTFWTDLTDDQPEDHPDYLPPGAMLAELQDLLHEVVSEQAAGTRYWRAAEHDEAQTLPVPDRFTSPPLQFAHQPNRMSPAGIPMFYGADGFDTAVAEVAEAGPTQGRAVSAVQFESCRPLLLLDLTELRRAVSYFAPNGRDAWHRSAFLRYFARDISEPIRPDGRQHIDYVPTQVFTEFVRFHMRSESGAPMDGIRYRSSRTRHPCVVLFFDQEDCLRSRDGRPQSLACITSSIRTVRHGENGA